MGEASEKFDVIIIGSGLGGLTAAATLAKAGRKVLVAEKEPHVGGYFGPVLNGPYYFNNGPRLLMGCHADGPYGPGMVYSLLENLGVREQCEFIPVQPFTTVQTPDLEFKLWSGREAFVEGLNAACPGGFERLPELLELCGRIHQASLLYYQSERPWGLAKHAWLMRSSISSHFKILEDVLKRYIPLERQRQMVGALWPYLDLPPRRASFLIWAVLMATYIDEGAYFCRGGLHRLSLAVASALERDGGELALEAPVERILVHERQVQGVELAGGRQCFARTVIADIDPRQALGELVDPEQRPQRYLGKLAGLELSTQAVNLSLVTDLDLPGMGMGYEKLFIGDLDGDRAWQKLEDGQPAVFGVTMMDAADPGMAPAGEHLLNLISSQPSSFNRTPENVRRAVDALLAAVEKQFPGLSSRLVWKRRGEIPDGYLTSVFEPIYGWASSPRNAGLLRLSPRTPVKGLTLAGQWTRPGQGSLGVVYSGLEAARMVRDAGLSRARA